MSMENLDMAPIEAFLSLKDLPLPFILSGGPLPWQRRYSLVGAMPFCVLTVDSYGNTTVNEQGREGETHPPTLPSPGNPCGAWVGGEEKTGSDFFSTLANIISRHSQIKIPPHPPLFQRGGDRGGLAVGWFSYDLKNLIPPHPALSRGTHAKRGSGRGKKNNALPLAHVGLYDTVYVYDHLKESGNLTSMGIEKEAKKMIETALFNLRPPHPPLSPLGRGETLFENNFNNNCNLKSNITKEKYISMVNKALEYIASGDIYQINLSRRLEIPCPIDPCLLYQSIIKYNPSRFPSMLDMGEFKIISNSPERLLRIQKGIVETEPIKGTRPRGKTPDQDALLIEELKNSPKESAEHVMIVDLERSDIGKISRTGTVSVSSFKRIETYPTLHHIVSTVRGILKPDLCPVAALKEVFPGGSVTGTPKIRAMEIIAEIEPHSRGIYTGGIGWMDFNGNMDIAMAIRTAIYKDNTLSLYVGSGIVADSIPKEEYEETTVKALDFLRIIQTAYGR